MAPHGEYTFLTIYNTGSKFVQEIFVRSEHLLNGSEALSSSSIEGEPYLKVVSYISHREVVGAQQKRYKSIYAGLILLLMLLSTLYGIYMVEKKDAEERRKKEEERLRAQEKQYRMLHKNAFDGIVISDKNGIIIDSNTSLENIFGYEEDELIGENIVVLIPEEYGSKHDKGFNKFIETGEGSILGMVLEVTGKRKTGEVFSNGTRTKPAHHRWFTPYIRYDT